MNEAKRYKLREFQEKLAERLRRATSTPTGVSKLGFLIGDNRWLVDLSEAGEILSVPPIAPVPLAKPWLKGLCSLRGNLFTVIDWARFGSGQTTPLSKESRILAFNERLGINTSILVSRMLGLRSLEQFEKIGEADVIYPWLGDIFRDGDGHQWRELRFAFLCREDAFLSVGI